MQLGMVGLGRMGANLTRRLMRAGHEVVVYDIDADAIAVLEGEGATGAASLEDLVSALQPPRAAWIMVPAAYAGETAEQLAGLMDAGDIVIDGGNTYYRDDVERAKSFATKGVQYVDVGTSGGVFGLDRGFCMMIGGEPEIVAHLDPIFAALAPGVDAAPRTPGRESHEPDHRRSRVPALRSGRGGALREDGAQRHRVRAHGRLRRGVERAAPRRRRQPRSGPPTPRRRRCASREFYRYDIDTTEVAEVWRRGSVVGSWLLDLTAAALLADPDLDGFQRPGLRLGRGAMDAARAAIDEGVPVHVLSAALFDRFESRGEAEFANRVLSAHAQGVRRARRAGARVKTAETPEWASLRRARGGDATGAPARALRRRPAPRGAAVGWKPASSSSTTPSTS